jgi:hypothetical protein
VNGNHSNRNSNGGMLDTVQVHICLSNSPTLSSIIYYYIIQFSASILIIYFLPKAFIGNLVLYIYDEQSCLLLKFLHSYDIQYMFSPRECQYLLALFDKLQYIVC